MKDVTMKNSIKKIFFGVVLLGSYQSYGTSKVVKGEDFGSLESRSPFGDTPKPIEPKPQPPQKSEQEKTAVPVQPQVQRESNAPKGQLYVSGHMRINGKDCFVLRDKTTKDPISTVLAPQKKSPLGYEAVNFDLQKQTVEIKFHGQNHVCKIGEEEKKASALSNAKVNPNQKAPANSQPSSSFDYSDEYDDYWDWDSDYEEDGW
jgi:hypothetical protein